MVSQRRQEKKAKQYADRLQAVSLPAYKGMHLIADDAPTTLCGLTAKDPVRVGASERHRGACKRCVNVMRSQVDSIRGVSR